MLWYKKHGHNYDWFKRISETGVKVKALDDLPEMLYIDEFYYDMYISCGTSVSNIISYCNLYDFSVEEILDSIKILGCIDSKVR